MGVIKGLGRGQLRGVTGREGFELKEKKEEKMRRTYTAWECPSLPPAESEGKILQFVLIGFAGGTERRGGRRAKLKTNKTLLICNCYLGVEQTREMPNRKMMHLT